MPPQNLRVSRRLLVQRLPRPTIYSAVELALLALLAVQSARLVYAFVTPVGPIGAWQPPGAARPVPALAADLGGTDPFFRLTQASGAPAVVTSLNLQLFGVREDRATGRGSAIISTPDGVQQSFAVGDEIVPGVRLTAVGFDSVTISRGGVPEQLFLDQSGPPGAQGPQGPNTVPGAVAPSAPMPIVTAPPPPPMAPPPPVVRNGTGQ